MKTKELKALIKESVREVLREERLIQCNDLIPYVTDKEQTEIETEYGSPSDYETDEWDKQIETDLAEGKLNQLIAKAEADINAKKVRNIDEVLYNY